MPRPQGMTGAIRKAEQMVATMPNSYMLQQFDNPANPEAHYKSTGPEIWEQMDGKIDVFVAGMGTGGTIGGVGRFLKEKNPAVRVVAVDVEGSVFTEYFRTGKTGKSAPYLLEGLGDEFLIGCADFFACGRLILTPAANIGAVIMNTISSTSITSTSGVTLMSASG